MGSVTKTAFARVVNLLCEAKAAELGFALFVLFIMPSCGVAGRAEHEAGVKLTAALRSRVCALENGSSTEPCGTRDVRYEASPGHLYVNVYGVVTPEEQFEDVAVIRRAKEKQNIHFRITIRFLKSIEDHKLVHTETIGD